MAKSMIPKAVQVFEKNTEIRVAFLFGSQSDGSNHADSDWDFAILFCGDNGWDNLGYKEELRHQLSQTLQVPDTKIDLVDISSASLSILSTIAHEGTVIKGEGTMELIRFYLRVWSLEEDINRRSTYGY